MSQDLEAKPPAKVKTKRAKTGGRKVGSFNKNNIRMRDRFEGAGFDFVREVMTTLKKVDDPIPKLDALVRLAPYFMQRLREETEATPTPDVPGGRPNNIQINNYNNKTATQLMTELLGEVLGKKPASKPE